MNLERNLCLIQLEQIVHMLASILNSLEFQFEPGETFDSVGTYSANTSKMDMVNYCNILLVPTTFQIDLVSIYNVHNVYAPDTLVWDTFMIN